MSDSQLSPSVIRLLDKLDAAAAAVGSAMAEAIVRDVAAIRAAARHDRTFLPRFRWHCQAHVRTFSATTRERRVAEHRDLEFVREVGVRRAEDAFPLAALLEGLRVGHRVLSQRIADYGGPEPSGASAALWLTGRSIEYLDAASHVLSESYLARQRVVISRTELTRRELLDDLLEGRYASRQDAADVAASFGFEPDEQYCVAVLVPRQADAHDADAERLAQILAAEVSRAASGRTPFRFVVARRDEVVAMLRAPDSADVVARGLAAFAHRVGADPARAGLSTACRGIVETPRGYWEAARALRVASAEQPCIDLRQLGLLSYLTLSADSVAQRLAAQCAGPLGRASSRSLVALADTVLSYVEAGGSSSLTAQRLHVHLNTVHNRLERVAGLVQRPSLAPMHMVELAAAIRICRTFAHE